MGSSSRRKTTRINVTQAAMSDDEEEMMEGGAGAALTEPIRAGEVKKGMIVLLQEKPCKVGDISTSCTGKDGHAEAVFTGKDIFTGKEYEDTNPTSKNMVKPVVVINSYSLSDINDEGYCTLMSDDGEMREDLKCPDEDFGPAPEMGKEIKEAVDEGKEVRVTVTKAMENEAITNYKLVVEE